MPDPIRILVADDHLIIRQGLRLILETQEGFEMVGEAADGAEALRLCAELKPDVVLMDLRMPGMDGLTAIERLQAGQPEIAVVILTTFNEDDLMMRGLRPGRQRLFAQGYRSRDPLQYHPGRPAWRDPAQAGDHGTRAFEDRRRRCCSLRPDRPDRAGTGSAARPSPRVSAARRSPSAWASASGRSRRTWPASTTGWEWIAAPPPSRWLRRKACCQNEQS